MPGAGASDAAGRKRQDTYPELLAARRCRLVVIGLEVGGRMDTETVAFLRQLAAARARASEACRMPGQHPQMDWHAGGGGPARVCRVAA